MNEHETYETPLSSRYASKEMSYLFSPAFKFLTWRRLWLALAKSQKSLGLTISDSQIKALESHLQPIDYELANRYEKTMRHDVMAHLYAYGDACPEAKPILHLGATSCYITDNADLIQMREAFKILQAKLVHVIRELSDFAAKHANLACLSFTHLQAAQPTTVGKRTCLWIQDLLLDLHDLNERLENFSFLGVKGATGTQASFLSLFEGDHEKVKKLERLVAQEMGFNHVFVISGQTYTRKQDMRLFSVLTGIAASCHKMATDLRLLAHLKEIEEPFAEKQVGSSAMPYKRNPMRSERICGLARFLISLNENPIYTASTQWLERTLDDSSNRRLAIPEGFLCADALLNLLLSLSSGLIVYPKMIEKHLQEELPFLATENILMQSVRKGKDRQVIHEKLRQHSVDASRCVKEQGLPCDLLQRIAKDPSFGLSEADLAQIVKIEHFIGRSQNQVKEFLDIQVKPLLKRYEHLKPHISPIEV